MKKTEKNEDLESTNKQTAQIGHQGILNSYFLTVSTCNIKQFFFCFHLNLINSDMNAEVFESVPLPISKMEIDSWYMVKIFQYAARKNIPVNSRKFY